MKTFFITGIDTDIGKTFISLLLMLSFRHKGLNAGYMKPIETGVKINKDGSKEYLDGRFVKIGAGLKANIEEIVPFTFQTPLAPYAASKIEGGHICIKDIINKFYELKDLYSYDYMIVEGAGGMLVPLKKGHFMIDLATYIDASVILVTKAGLGMINQTLLNIEYAKSRGIKIAGIIINNARKENDESISSNREILSEFTDIEILGSVPFFDGAAGMKTSNESVDESRKSEEFIKSGGFGENINLEDFALKHIDIDKILV